MGNKSTTPNCKNCKLFLKQNQFIINSGLCAMCKFTEVMKCDTNNFEYSKERISFIRSNPLIHKDTKPITNDITKIIDLRYIPRDKNTIIIWPSRSRQII